MIDLISQREQETEDEGSNTHWGHVLEVLKCYEPQGSEVQPEFGAAKEGQETLVSMSTTLKVIKEAPLVCWTQGGGRE